MENLDFIDEELLAELSPERRELLGLFLNENVAESRLRENYVAPRNSIEEKLVTIWTQVLGGDNIGIEHNYFEIGGDSIQSVQIIAKAHQEGLVLTTNQLFEFPTIAQLGKVIKQTETSADNADQSDLLPAAQSHLLEDKNVEDAYELSPMQHGMLFDILSAPHSELYLEHTVSTIYGTIETKGMQAAWQKIVDRHPALRTAFVWEKHEQPAQIVYRQAVLSFEELDWRILSPDEQNSTFEDFLHADRTRGFDLNVAPLMRLTIIRLEENISKIVWTNHHLILDAWCVSVLLREIFTVYEAARKGLEPVLPPVNDYKAYIAWLKRQNIADAEHFWRGYLANFSRRTRIIPESNSTAGDNFFNEKLRISTETTQQLMQLARRYQLTANTVLQGAWSLFLMHLSRENDVLFGTVFSGRPPSLPGVEAIIGLFINTLPVRVQVEQNMNLSEWLKQLHTKNAELYEWEHTPFSKIAGWSDVEPRTPLFESILVFMNAAADVENFKTAELEIRDVYSLGHSNYPLTVRVTPSAEMLIEAIYNERRITGATVKVWLSRFAALLGEFVRSEDRNVSELLDFLDADARKQSEMQAKQRRSSLMSQIRTVKPKTVTFTNERLVTTEFLKDAPTFPIVFRSVEANVDVIGWLNENRATLNEQLLRRGAILLRGFMPGDIQMFEGVLKTLNTELLPYKERSTPRSAIKGNIYTSTEYPAHQHIALHNEFSYAATFPRKILFFCEYPAVQGGETPIADCRRVFNLLEPEVREEFIRKGIMYARNYGTGIDLSWQEVFQTDDKREVEDHCRRAPMEFEWLDENRLRTRQIRPAVIKHPETDEVVWFNQAHLFHISNLGEETSRSMLEEFGKENLPRNAYYGDGSPIPDEIMNLVRVAYQKSQIAFAWERGDVLILDNILIAHGRHPYAGKRKIAVAMTEGLTRSVAV